MTELWICRHNGLSSEQERTWARKVLNAALSERIPHCSEQLRFEYGRYGKPYLKDESLQFSLSYTHGAYIIALSGGEIGADIERLRAAKPHVAARCFTDTENSYLSADMALFDQRFYELWTKKEAYLKYTGEGFYRSPKSIDVLSCPIRNSLYTLTEDDVIISLCGQNIQPVSVYKVSVQEH